MASDSDLWIFRDGRGAISTRAIVGEIKQSLETFSRTQRPDDGLTALIRAGQIESALADIASPLTLGAAAVTDAIALALSGNFNGLGAVLDSLKSFEYPETLCISTPEGFAYYSLDPMSFARSAFRIVRDTNSVLVIGIRSIGTTLSALVQAVLSQKGHHSERITVRPTGDPYNRVTHFSAGQSRTIEQYAGRNAAFLIVDEGPGRSGSSFLSVAERLMASGVRADEIILLGSADPNLEQLRGRDAAERWKRFRFFSGKCAYLAQFRDCENISGGEWRTLFMSNTDVWPSSWRQMERLKFLSPDHKLLFKSEGFGPFREVALERANCLKQAGFGCTVEKGDGGFLAYRVVEGKPMDVADLSSSLVERLADYCAFRSREFRVPHTSGAESLAMMLNANLQKEFGKQGEFEFEHLDTACTVLADARMQPHEWIRTADGTLIKTDGVSHGDDHFFPGPCDIAWDLAGAIVEWGLSASSAKFLLERFKRLTGDDVSPRLPEFLLAYSIFRLGYCKMAAASERDLQEMLRLRRDYVRYRVIAENQLCLSVLP